MLVTHSLLLDGIQKGLTKSHGPHFILTCEVNLIINNLFKRLCHGLCRSHFSMSYKKISSKIQFLTIISFKYVGLFLLPKLKLVLCSVRVGYWTMAIFY